MSGFWEQRDHPTVLGAVIHVEQTTVAWAFGLKNLRGVQGWTATTGQPFDMARNTCCMRALESGAEWLFFLDSDVIPPPDAVQKLLARRVPLISGVYCRRSPPHGVPVAIKNGQWVTKFTVGELMEVDVVGAGCLLIHRSILEKLPPQRPGHHWFDWCVDLPKELAPYGTMSEDFTFVRHVKHVLGIPTLLDTSVLCKHVGMAQATLGQLSPLELAA